MLRLLIAALLLAGCSVCYPCSELRKEDGVWHERRCGDPSNDARREALRRQREELDAIAKQAREAFERGDRLK